MKKIIFLLLFFSVTLYSQEAVESSGPIHVIDLSDDGHMVDQVQAEFIIESLEKAQEQKAKAVVLVIDTFGGLVFSAREITEKLLRMDVPTIAYVKTKAISAGTFIAWACDRIVMQKHTTMGDAQMILQTMEGIKEAPEKAVTVFRSDWKKASDLKNRSFAIAQAFFDAKLQVIWVEKDSEKSFMLQEDYDLLSDEEKKEYKILKVVCKKDQLLTVYAEEAEELGLVEVSEDLDSFLATLGAPKEVEKVAMTNNQKILRFLGANSWIFFILTLIGLNGIYAEIKAPGFGIPGFTALVCFTLVFGTRYLLGTANEVEIAVFILGILLCLVEIFVLPGLGVIGLLGILCLFGALVFSSLPNFGWPDTDFEWNWFHEAARLMIVCFILSFVSFFFVLPSLLNFKGVQKRLLANEMKAEEGYVVNAVGDASALLGVVGTAASDLKPLGKMRLPEGKLIDVTTGSSYVDKGEKVKIIQVDGNRIIVTPEGSNT